MKFSRFAYNAIGGVASLVVASTLASQSASAQQRPDEIARQVINGDVQSITQAVRDQLQTQTGAAVPGTAGLMRFTAEPSGSAVYQEAFGALAYAKEPLLTKAPLAPAPSLIWGVTTTGTVDTQSSSISGVAGSSVATTEVALAAVDVTKVGIFGTKDALNLLVVASDAFTQAG